MVAVTLNSALFFFASPVFSAPIILQTTNHFCDDRSPNSVGLSPGRRLTFTANFTPDGDLTDPFGGPPDGFADSDGTSPPSTVVASQDGVVRDLRFSPNVANANHFVRSRAFDCDNPGSPDLKDSWTIDITNGLNTLMAFTPDVQGVLHVPFVKSMSLTDSGTTPTFNWTYPAGIMHDRVRISIRNLGDFIDQGGVGGGGNAREIFAMSIPSTDTSFTMPAGELLENHLYTVAIQLDSRRPPQAGFGRLQSRSRSFFDFSTEILDVPGNAPVSLPIVDPTGSPTGGFVYTFAAEVQAGQTIFVDPAVAIGYDYEIGDSDPNFASVLLPEAGDNLFDLYLFDGTDFVFETTLQAGVEHSFNSGVDRFRILGIEASAGLDPNDVTAFVTGLTFVSDGQFTGTMTPITADTLCSNLGDNRRFIDVDIYTLQGTAGEELVVTVEELENDNNEGNRATLILKDKIKRARLFRIDRRGLPNEVEAILPASGQYRIIVAEQPRWARGRNFTGDYCISVQSSGDAAQTLEATRWVEEVF